MGVAIILLIIIVIIILIYAIYYMLSGTQVLYDLNTQQPAIPFDKITSPNSIRYTYSMWIYVNVWPQQKTKIFSAEGTSGSPKYTGLYLAGSTPALTCEVYTAPPPPAAGATLGSPVTKTVQITTNFPMQRWVHIVISLDGTVIDCYLDGKLVRSMDLGTATAVDTITGTGSNTYTITFGTMNAFLTSFNRKAGATDPQSVWNQYLAGNGYDSKLASSYGFKFEVNKDKEVVAAYKY
jgi:hypothetical protein